ncbi:hypothetical protein CLOM_g3363 [Closterium sp. NIES-68]|nr:hypothetical protein CLOM_g3363 [Closterium sp. NIES-68]
MASRLDQEAAMAVLAQAESLLIQSRADNALALLVKLERATPGAKGLAELLAVAQVLAAVGHVPECPRCRRPIGPLPKDYVDWFSVLQVDARTDEGGIKKRYRQLALLLHPDKNKSQKAQEAFRYVKEAHTVLTDGNKRAVFDALRSRLPPCPCSAPAGGRAMGMGAQRGVQRGGGDSERRRGTARTCRPRVTSVVCPIGAVATRLSPGILWRERPQCTLFHLPEATGSSSSISSSSSSSSSTSSSKGGEAVLPTFTNRRLLGRVGQRTRLSGCRT